MTIAETTTDTVGASIDLAREPVNRSRMLDYHVYGTLWSFCHAREHAMQPQVLTCNRSWHQLRDFRQCTTAVHATNGALA